VRTGPVAKIILLREFLPSKLTTDRLSLTLSVSKLCRSFRSYNAIYICSVNSVNMKKEKRNLIWRSNDRNVLLMVKRRMIRNPTRNRCVAKCTTRWPKTRRRKKKKSIRKSSLKKPNHQCIINKDKFVNAMRENIHSISGSMITLSIPTSKWRFLNIWKRKNSMSMLARRG
jgi:hypothetical protein